MSKRPFIFLSFVFVACGVAAVACSFPDVSFSDDAPETGVPDTSMPKPMATGDATPPKPPTKTDVDPDGGAQEASTRPPDSGRIEADAATCGCDCDNDTFQNKLAGCDGGPGPVEDCDDFDRYIKPNQTFSIESAWSSPHKPDFDFNCDGVRTKQWPYDVDCSKPSNCVEGFAGDPNCGETVMNGYNICKYNPGIAGILLASCKVDHKETRTQGCK